MFNKERVKSVLVDKVSEKKYFHNLRKCVFLGSKSWKQTKEATLYLFEFSLNQI